MHLLDDFAQKAKNYLAGNDNGRVFPPEQSIVRLKELDTPLQADPVDPAEVLNLLDEVGSPATVRNTSGRYYGFVTGGSLPAAMGAKLMSSIWDQNSALRVMSPVSSALEDIAGRWLVDLFGLPADSGFGFVTGDTMANFTALAAARHQVLKNAGWDAEANGLFGAPEIRVLVGDEVHISVLKTLSMLGLGRDRIIRIPVDRQGRMMTAEIEVSDEPTIICAQSGNVNSGAFDDVAAICQKKGKNTWVHVDAAFGLWAAVSNSKKHLVTGVELADSWATDAHKWLNVPYDCGVAFVRNKAALFAAMSASAAAYIPTDETRQPLQFVPEMSRQARAIPVWAALKSLGKKGLAELVDRNCSQAQQFAKGLNNAGFAILNDIVLNQVLVHFGDAERTQKVIQEIQEEGVCWCGSTAWQGKPAMRISISGWNTTDEDVQRSLESMIRHIKS
jgi:glutamate/tyrosine decarboxylase-like PLP-dependent enzyme